MEGRRDKFPYAPGPGFISWPAPPFAPPTLADREISPAPSRAAYLQFLRTPLYASQNAPYTPQYHHHRHPWCRFASPSSRRHRVSLTETPGKSTHCEQLAEASGLKHLAINDVVKDKKTTDGYDDVLKSWIVDEDKLLDEIEEQVEEGGNIIDWHVCDIFPKRWIDLVVVLRADSSVLYDRLKAR